MRWFRTNRAIGGRLALFALAIQLVLSFGHIHLEDIYGNARAFVLASTSLAQPAADESKPFPTHPRSNHTDDYCAICATIHLLASSFATEAPQLPLPIASRAIEHSSRVVLFVVAPRRAPFQSRAPPQA
jgi:hypothetical protein